MDSEQEYCTQLWMVVNVYQVPLQDGHYMSSRQLCLLFPSPLGELCEQHCQMLHSLQDRLVHWSYTGVVGDVFARLTDSNSVSWSCLKSVASSLLRHLLLPSFSCHLVSLHPCPLISHLTCVQFIFELRSKMAGSNSVRAEL